MYYSRQDTELEVAGLNASVFDVKIERLMVGLQEEKGEGSVKWFGTLLVGATRYTPGDGTLSDDTRFSAGLGLGVKTVWTVVYPPSYTPPTEGEELVNEVDLGLPPLHMISTNVSDMYGTFYPAFSESGIYRVVVYAVDEEGLAAEPQVVEIHTDLPFKVYLPLVLK